MTDAFDPTRPFQYENGEKPRDFFVLSAPTERGHIYISISPSGRALGHVANGICEGVDGFDLVNITEEVTVGIWAIVNKAIGGPMVLSCDKALLDRACGENEAVVRMTGTYTR